MIGQILGPVQSVIGPPTKERKTIAGKFLQRLTTGSNFVSGTSSPAAAVQQKPLASGQITFGMEQRNRNLLNIAALAVVALIGWRFFGKKRRR